MIRDLSALDASELCGFTLVRRNEVAFSLLFALDAAACAAAHGGVRTDVGAIYLTALAVSRRAKVARMARVRAAASKVKCSARNAMSK